MSHLDDLFGLRGRTALVTGASSGLGADCARAFAKAGADVGLVARRADRLEDLAREISALGVRCSVAPADVTDAEAVEAAIDKVEAELGHVGILLNGAGISVLGRAERAKLERWQSVIDVNLTAAFVASQAVGKRMIERGSGGNIINLSSVMGSRGNSVHLAVAYTTSKSGLDGLTRQLAVEWAKHDIRVNALAPSYFPTEMTSDPRTGAVPEDHQARMEIFTPMGRLGRAGELDTALLFLAAPASTYITGAIIPVDGGWTAW